MATIAAATFQARVAVGVVPEASEEPPEPAFRTVYDFYEGIYGLLYEHFDSSPGVMAQRGTSDTRWCKQWWNNESVMMRMLPSGRDTRPPTPKAAARSALGFWITSTGILTGSWPPGATEQVQIDHGGQMVRYPTDPLPEGLNVDSAAVISSETPSQGLVKSA